MVWFERQLSCFIMHGRELKLSFLKHPRSLNFIIEYNNVVFNWSFLKMRGRWILFLGRFPLWVQLSFSLIYCIWTSTPRRSVVLSPVGDTFNVCPGVHLSILIFIFPMGYENWDSKIPLVIALFWALKNFIMDGWWMVDGGWMESFFFFFFLHT